MDLDQRSENDESLPKQKLMCGVVEGFYGKPWTSEQRKDLFHKMKKWGMDSYLYAPKDDYKHRSFWRSLYTVEETEHLSGLIAAAKENGIRFIYAISPGLDITYSSSKDIAILKRKLEQVKQLDCKDFAILFDDIDVEMSKSDKEMFKSFADAQVAVSNDLFQFINPDKFLFCPTEYCAARAVPNVKSSEYLRTIGTKLDFQFDILWTGGKVVSKDISLDSIDEVAEVICRPPVIWDNLHANDYDQKRIFLGPYEGRSPQLIQRIRGVLTNPNCEYGSNFVAIHTLAQWAKCSEDAPTKPRETMNSDAKLETENSAGHDVPDNLSPHVYHPTSALKTALGEWLEEFKKPKDVRGPVLKAPVVPVPLPPPVATCSTITTMTHTTSMATPTNLPTDMAFTTTTNCIIPIVSSSANGSSLIPPIPLMNSLAAENKIICTPEPVPQTSNGSTEINPPTTLASRNSVTGLEPMDTVSIPASPVSLPEKMSEAPSAEGLNKSSSEDVLMEAQYDSQTESAPPSVMALDSDVEVGTQTSVSVSANSSTMQEDDYVEKNVIEDDDNSLTVEDLHLLCDLFYLPYDHGAQGNQLLNEFHWLKTNAHVVTGCPAEDNLKPEVVEWHSRARDFEEIHKNLLKMVGRLNLVPNRDLLYELYPYIYDMRGVVSLLNSYIKWLAIGQNVASNASIHGNYTCRQYSAASLLYQLLSLYNNRE